MYVRAITEEDLPALYDLCAAASGTAMPQQLFAGVLRAVLSDKRRRVVIAFEGERAVGYGDLQVELLLSSCTFAGLLQELYVEEAVRGKNIGTGMLIALSGQAKTLGCTEIRANTSRVNLKAQSFLERHGFVKTQHLFSKSLK